jgi:urease accessory protein
LKRDPQNEPWLIWQLTDSAFPSGGFAHSSGLEAAWQHGEIAGNSDLVEFLKSSLRQFGHASAPFFVDAYDSPNRLDEFDRHCDAFLSNHVANRASRLQGKAFASSAVKIFGLSQTKIIFGHFAPTCGFVLRKLGLKRREAIEAFLFQHLRGLVAAAVRLGIVGPLEGQSLQYRIMPHASEILDSCQGFRGTEATQTAPLLEIWQGAQDRLYSRLFQS